MPSHTDSRFRFQTGLRRILLWMVAAALYLGTMRLLHADVVTILLLGCWLLAIGALRVVFPLVVMVLLSAVLGAVAFTRSQPPTVIDLLGGIFIGACVGGSLVVVVDISAAVIDWIDKKMAVQVKE